MTKAMIELYDDYKAGAPGNNGWDIKRQIFAWAIPMHDGSIRYFKERGLWTAEHQAHNDALVKRQEVLSAAWQVYKAKAPADDAAFKQGWIAARAAALTKAGMEVVHDTW
jgi:hypothetical protein